MNRAVPLTAGEFRYGFANAVTEAESADLYQRWTILGPGRSLFQAAFANLNPNAASKVDTGNATRGPLLLIAGEIDSGRREVADTALAWIKGHSLQ